MKLLDWLRNLLPKMKVRRAPGREPFGRALPSGRASVDQSDTFGFAGWIVVPPADYESNWRLLNLDARTLDRMTPAKLLEMLSDLSPEVSRALWDFLRLCNPGWEATALQPGSQEIDEAAQAALDAFLNDLADAYGSADILFGRLFMGAFLRGALCAELVLERGRVPVDIATPDPNSIRFRRRDDAVRGAIWQPGQWQAGRFVALSRATFRYTPIDPFPASPYGRPLAAPALFTTLFLLGMLHDLRRVVQQQGYPRLDLSLDSEKLLAMRPDLMSDPEAFAAFIQQIVNEVETVYSQLEPDDAYIHTDTVIVNRPVGTVDASSLSAIDGLITALERMATRALKSMPLMMGMEEAVSETHANRQWEIMAAGVKSIQHYSETLLARLLTLALEAQGLQAVVKFRFAELRAAELLRDAQTEMMRIQNARAKYDNGWTSQDEAAEEIVGHAADLPAPRRQTGGMEFIQDDGDGQERARKAPAGTRGARVKLIPDGADEPLTPVPDAVEITDSDIMRGLDQWDDLMPDEAGLLDAAVEGATDFDDERWGRARKDLPEWTEQPPAGWARYVYARADADPSPWIWSQSAKRYRNTMDGRFIGQRQMTALRDVFIDAKRETATALTNRLATGDLTIQQWELSMRQEVKTAFVDEYVLGKGGRHNMTQADWGATGRMVRGQYSHLHTFAEDIAGGNLSAAQIEARSRQYFNSATQAFERGRGASYGVRNLPAHPADGSTRCRSNCRCSWSIEETDEAWNCYWRVDRGAESCEDCLERGQRWNPLVIAKDGRSRAQIERELEELTNDNGLR